MGSNNVDQNNGGDPRISIVLVSLLCMLSATWLEKGIKYNKCEGDWIILYGITMQKIDPIIIMNNISLACCLLLSEPRPERNCK